MNDHAYFLPASATRVVDLQEDGKFTDKSVAIHTGNGIWKNLEDFSICFRVSLTRLRGQINTVVSYAVPESDNELTAGEISCWKLSITIYNAVHARFAPYSRAFGT